VKLKAFMQAVYIVYNGRDMIDPEMKIYHAILHFARIRQKSLLSRKLSIQLYQAHVARK